MTPKWSPSAPQSKPGQRCACYPPWMILIADEFRGKWERDRECREIGELERLAAWILGLRPRSGDIG